MQASNDDNKTESTVKVHHSQRPLTRTEILEKFVFWPEILPLYLTIKYIPYGASTLPVPKFHFDSIIKQTVNPDFVEFQYPWIQGKKALREAVLAHFPPIKDFTNAGIEVKIENIAITPGAVPGINSAIESLCNPANGDEFIVFEPIYPFYLGRPSISNINVRVVAHKFDKAANRFELDIDAISKAITTKTKAILICNPDNPTTRVWTKEEWQKLSDLLLKHPSIFVIEDCAYWLYHEENHKPIPFATIHKDNFNKSIAVYSCGKMYDVTGLRVGICVGSQAAMKGISNNLGETVDMAPSFEQMVITDNLKTAMEPYLEDPNFYESRRRLIVNNALLIKKEFESIGISVPEPEGTYYITINVENFRTKIPEKYYKVLGKEEVVATQLDQAFCRMLLVEKKVGMIPLSCIFFGEDVMDSFIRIPINRKMDDLWFLVESVKSALAEFTIKA
jgi:aspartate/methionine/tyrosine aminotransferase